jgi:hypothetical protein
MFGLMLVSTHEQVVRDLLADQRDYMEQASRARSNLRRELEEANAKIARMTSGLKRGGAKLDSVK